MHIGNVWARKHTVIVILVSAPFPWSWVGDRGPQAWQLGLRYDIRIYLKTAGKNKEAWSYILYHFEITFCLPLLITRMWQPCYLAAAECYSEIIDFTHSSDLVSDCIHSCWSVPNVRCSAMHSGPAATASSGQPGSHNWFTLFYTTELPVLLHTA